MSNAKKILFAFPNFAVIEEMAYALLLLLGTTVKNSKQFCTAMEKLIVCTINFLELCLCKYSHSN